MKGYLGNLTPYKHYIFILIALVVANYVLVPLSEWQKEQASTLSLLSKQQRKVKALIDNKEHFDLLQLEVNAELKKNEQYLFSQSSESNFKLIAQSTIEGVLNDAGCTIQRIGFKGNTAITNDINRWVLELRYQGDSECMLKTTRGLESLIPIVNITDFNFNHRGLKKEGQGSFNAQLTATVWHYLGTQS